MIDTKLILIEGLPGSGKTMTAELLAAEIRTYGKKCLWFNEWAENHPVFISIDHLSEVISSSRLREKTVLQKWEKFAEEMEDERTVYIFESRFWQTDVMFMYLAGHSKAEVVESNQRIITAITGLNPVMIYFTHDNIEAALTRTFQAKHEGWEQLVLGFVEQQKWATDRGLKGREAWFKFFSEWALVAERLYARLTFPKIKVQNPHSDWDLVMRKIREFLELV